jgi:hypothetical protein
MLDLTSDPDWDDTSIDYETYDDPDDWLLEADEEPEFEQPD